MADKKKPFVKTEPRSSRWQVWLPRARRFVVNSSLPEIMLLATLCLSRYMQNSDFSYPSEVVLNIVLLGIIATGVFYLYRLILRSPVGAHVAALLLSYGLYGFVYSFGRLHHWGDYLIPDGATGFEHDVLMALFLALIFGVAGFAVQRLFAIKQLKTVPLLKFGIFVIAFIFAVQLGKVGLRMWDIRKDLAYKQPVSSLAKPTAATDKPNVYYLLLDRYASAETLKNVYKYDNSAFLNQLQQEGFVLRENAYANYPFTMMSASSTLSAGYHTELGKQFRTSAAGFQTAFPYRQALDRSPVAQAFQANGYSYNQVSSWWDFTRINPSADSNPAKSYRLRIFGKDFWLTDLQRDIVNKSILSPLLLKGMTIKQTPIVKYDLDRNPSQNFYAQMQALQTIAAGSKTQQKPQFTFAHIMSPHDPYVFDTSGNSPGYDGNRTDNGADEYVKYVNQLQYVNTQFTKLIHSIRTDDPRAVIVIQADEGPYPKQFRGTLTKQHYYDPVNLPTDAMQQKFGVLAAYYMPGTDAQTVTANMNSNVNSFRFVLNRYLGYRLPMLPDCQFSVGNKYDLYTYKLVSGRLKGGDTPASCTQYQ